MRDIQVVCRRIIEALVSQIGIAGVKSSRSNGARYSVDVAISDGEAPISWTSMPHCESATVCNSCMSAFEQKLHQKCVESVKPSVKGS